MPPLTTRPIVYRPKPQLVPNKPHGARQLVSLGPDSNVRWDFWIPDALITIALSFQPSRPWDGYQHALRFGPLQLSQKELNHTYRGLHRSTFNPGFFSPTSHTLPKYPRHSHPSGLRSGLTQIVYLLERAALLSCVAAICAHLSDWSLPQLILCPIDAHSAHPVSLATPFLALNSLVRLVFGLYLEAPPGQLQMYSAESPMKRPTRNSLILYYCIS